MTPVKTDAAVKRLYTPIIILAIIGIAAFLVYRISSTEPSAEKEAAVKKTAMLVTVEQLKRGTFSPRIEGLGKVQAARDIVLSPRINGQIVKASDNFMPGSLIKPGEEVLKLDPSDYQNTVKQMESTLLQAQSTLAIEQGHLEVAKKEYALLNRELSSEKKALILREPQMDAARSAVLSAEAALNQATLELSRTAVRAPFHAQIITRNVNLGSQVDSATELARLVGVDQYWVIVTVPVAQLRLIHIPENGEPGARVKIRNRRIWPEGAMREGEVMRLIGSLDEKTRLARIIVSVKDPLALDSETAPVIFVDSIVQAEIEGKKLKNVFRVERDYLHEGDTLWINKEDKLHIAAVEVLFKDSHYAYISEGIADGDLLVTSSLATVAQGVGLRTQAESHSKLPIQEEG